MGTNTGISYVEHSMSFWKGCTPVDECCDNCYAKDNAERFGWEFTRVQKTARGTWRKPQSKDRNGNFKWKAGDKVFVCSISDFYHQQADKWRNNAWDVIRKRPDLIWIIVTKRIERAINCFPENFTKELFPNIWIVPTCGTQKMADERIPEALKLKVKYPWIKIGVSLEPLLGEIDLQLLDFDGATGICSLDKPGGLDWVIIGAESKGAYPGRECKIEWVKSIAKQLRVANVPGFFKQLHLAKKPYGKYLEKDPKVITSKGYPQQYPKERQ